MVRVGRPPIDLGSVAGGETAEHTNTPLDRRLFNGRRDQAHGMAVSAEAGEECGLLKR